MTNQKTILTVVILILLVGNVYFGIKYSAAQKEIQQNQIALNAVLDAKKTQNQVLEFTKLFIQEVLKTETEVDFETRLKLENAVRNLGDQEILFQWQKFVESKTEDEAQEEVKNLLEMLVSKI